jgi:hypothetical protein
MKKILLSLLTLSLGLGAFSFAAYSPTETDTKQLNNLKQALTTVNDTDLWNYYLQFAKLQKGTMNTDERLDYLLTHLRDRSYTQFTTRKMFAKQQYKAEKTDFFDRYKNGILLEEEISEKCIGWYNTLDNMSFANDFPTALTIAVWYRESSCGYTLPRNGD